MERPGRGLLTGGCVLEYLHRSQYRSKYCNGYRQLPSQSSADQDDDRHNDQDKPDPEQHAHTVRVPTAIKPLQNLHPPAATHIRTANGGNRAALNSLAPLTVPLLLQPPTDPRPRVELQAVSDAYLYKRSNPLRSPPGALAHPRASLPHIGRSSPDCSGHARCRLGGRAHRRRRPSPGQGPAIRDRTQLREDGSRSQPIGDTGSRPDERPVPTTTVTKWRICASAPTLRIGVVECPLPGS